MKIKKSLVSLSIMICLAVTSFSALAKNPKTEVVKLFKQYQEATSNNDQKKSLSYAKDAYELASKKLTNEPKLIATLEHNLANAFHSTDNPEEALEHFKNLEATYKYLYGEISFENANLKMDFARAKSNYFDGSSYEERLSDIENIVDSALRIVEKLSGENSLLYAQYLVTSAQLFTIGINSEEKSISLLKKAFNITLKNPNSDYQSINNISKELIGRLFVKIKRNTRSLGSPFHYEHYYITDHEKYIQHINDVLIELENRNINGEAIFEAYRALRFVYTLKGDKENDLRVCKVILKNGDTTLVAPDKYPLIATDGPILRKGLSRKRKQGQVELLLDIDTNGVPRNISLFKLTGSESLVEPTIKSVGNWRYVPKCDGDEYVEAKGVHATQGFIVSR